MTDQERADAAVAAGTEWLDEQPDLEGWRDHVDLELLYMASTVNCVCGQLERSLHMNGSGDYVAFVSRHGLGNVDHREKLDFTAVSVALHGFDDLDNTWRAALSPASA